MDKGVSWTDISGGDFVLFLSSFITFDYTLYLSAECTAMVLSLLLMNVNNLKRNVTIQILVMMWEEMGKEVWWNEFV